MALRTPLPKTGKRSRQWASTRREVLPLLLERQDGRCAACGRELPESPDTHHVFGRGGTGARLGHYADRPELLVLLDRKCHIAVHDCSVPLTQAKLRWEAWGRFTDSYEPTLGDEEARAHMADGPIVAMRQSIRRIEAREG